MMGQLGTNSPLYNFLASTKNYKVSKACVFPFGFRKGKTGNLIGRKSVLYLVSGSIYSIIGKEKALYTCILDCDWRESRLPWLNRVMLCFVKV